MRGLRTRTRTARKGLLASDPTATSRHGDTRLVAAEPEKRGWPGPGGGRAGVIEPAPEYRGTSVQVCGLWPFSAGTTLPLVGVPLGPHWMSLSTVCCDPISWFLKGMINTPSQFVLGRPGLGKSSLVRRQVLGLAAWGYIPMVLSDLKPDYVELVKALGGQVITIGRGHGSVNLLDPGPLWHQLDRLPADERTKAVADLRARRLNTLVGLIQLVRGRDARILETETTILGAALREFDDRGHIPVIDDVLELVQGRHASLRAVALDRGDDHRYDEITEALQASLIALTANGRFGDTFARPTSQPIDLDKAVVFDLSNIDDSDEHMQAAAQLVCWSYGSSAVAGARLLANAGLRPQRHYFLVMDELWRMLRAHGFMVDRVDAITRLNRQLGIGQVLISHTMEDLRLGTEAETAKAWGFVARSEVVMLGGLAPGEMGNLATVFAMSEQEKALVTGWSDQTGYGHGDDRYTAPPGRGAFLIKVGKQPGIPVRVALTAAERHVNDTNWAWTERMTRGRR